MIARAIETFWLIIIYDETYVIRVNLLVLLRKFKYYCNTRYVQGLAGGKRRERTHWGDLGVDGWIILGWISRRWDVGILTGLGWPRIETGGGRL